MPRNTWFVVVNWTRLLGKIQARNQRHLFAAPIGANLVVMKTAMATAKTRTLYGGKDSKGSKAPTSSHASKASKSPKGSKAPTSSAASKGSKGTKGHGGPPPTHVPVYHPPAPDCDKPKIETCNPLENADSCGLHSSCAYACVPKFCKLPKNPHKIHGPSHTDADTYVKLGDVCGWMDYVPGEPKPRHEIEVCCETTDTSLDPHFGKCDACANCVSPQRVNDACCLAKDDDGHFDRMERAGDFHGCPSEKPVCCKCGDNEYSCIGSRRRLHQHLPDYFEPAWCRHTHSSDASSSGYLALSYALSHASSCARSYTLSCASSNYETDSIVNEP